MATETGWSDAATPTTAHAVQYGDASTSRTLEIITGNTKATITSISPNSDEITVTYVLYNEDSTNSSAKVQYSSTGQSGSFYDLTQSGGDTISSLTTSPSGTTHTFKFNSGTIFGCDYTGDVHIRVVAYDRTSYIGDTYYSDSIKHRIDNSPEAPTLVSPASGYFYKDTTPTLTFTIPNPVSCYSKMHFKVELDSVNTFDSSDLITFESRLDQTGWEYEDSSSVWHDIPADGVDVPSDHTLVGNNVRFTVQTDQRLTRKVYYWRALAGGVTT